MHWRFLRVGGACLALALLLPGRARSEDRARPDDLVIGMSAAFKGPSQGLGIELYRGARAYFDEVNRAGGVHGRKLVIRAYDDGYDPLPAIENTVRLVERDHVFLLFGYVGTPTVTRVLPLTKRYSGRSVYLFFPFTGAQPQRQPPYTDCVFNLRASYQQETAGLVEQFLRIGRKRIAVFYQIDAYGRSGWDGVRRALAPGLSIAAEATYKRGTPFTQDLRRQVDILRRADPDAVICVGAYPACAAFVRDARDAGWDVPIANVSFVGSENLLALLTAAGGERGRDYTANLINSQVVPSYLDGHLPAVREYRDLMARHDPAPPPAQTDGSYRPLPVGFVSLEGFLDAKVLVEVLRRLGPDPDRTRLRATVEAIRDLDLGIGVPVSFGPDKHQGLDQVYYTVAEDGRFVPIRDWTRWAK
jgi:ABC-type branched-subunit amino acid transport system substrate-binding protein